jgi:carbamoylphosphate synthase large subunit
VTIVKKIIPILTVPIVMIMLSCLIIPAYAMPGKDAGIPGGKMGGGTMTAHLDQFEEQGYDVSAIRAAIESGDEATARSLMQQFMEEHKDEFPSPDKNQDRMTARLDQLEEQGYDVSPIRAAIESGDEATARSLMQQFMEEHKDEFPSPPDRERPTSGIPENGGSKAP